MATAPEAAAADAGAAPAKKKRALPLWLVIALAVVLVGGGATAGFLLMHAKSAGAHAKKVKPAGPPQYLALKPFVVNFQGSQEARFLQVAIQVMSRDPKALTLVQDNDPVVRNNLLMLLGSQQYTTLNTEAGKEQLRAAVLAAIRKVVADAGGKPGEIEAVYFTSFVMQ